MALADFKSINAIAPLLFCLFYSLEKSRFLDNIQL